MEKTPP